MTWHMYKVISFITALIGKDWTQCKGPLMEKQLHTRGYQATEENEDPFLYWHEKYLRPLIK